MSVWYCIPSARPLQDVEDVLQLWRQQGYKIATWRDAPDIKSSEGLFVMNGKYRGYAIAVNSLVRTVLDADPDVQWLVTGGDDVCPDLNHTADEIASQCAEHFEGTFGVMQPTGDRFAGGSIDTICGSPWMGRDFCRRINKGHGPMWSEYTHMFVDKELQHVAIKYGCFWQRRDLIHLHKHFLRATEDLDSGTKRNPTPPHLAEANSAAHWQKYQKLFLDRQAAGFPGSEPLG